MPIDLVIDEREGGKGDLGDTNNNANRSTADSTSHTDGASTPDMVGSTSHLSVVSCLMQYAGFYLSSLPIAKCFSRPMEPKLTIKSLYYFKRCFLCFFQFFLNKVLLFYTQDGQSVRLVENTEASAEKYRLLVYENFA